MRGDLKLISPVYLSHYGELTGLRVSISLYIADVAVTFVGGVSKMERELETEFCEEASIFLNIIGSI